MDGAGSRAVSWRPAPKDLKGALAEQREPTRIAPGREDLGIQPRRVHDLDAGEIPKKATDLGRILHDHEETPRLAIPPPPHFPASRANVTALLRPLHVRVDAQAVQDLDTLLGRSAFRLEGLDAVLDHHR